VGLPLVDRDGEKAVLAPIAGGGEREPVRRPSLEKAIDLDQ
jgi:hypothetical protein